MHDIAERISPGAVFLITDHLKTQDMCIKDAEVDPWQLHHVLDHFKIQ